MCFVYATHKTTVKCKTCWISGNNHNDLVGLGFHICVWQNPTSINSDTVGNAKLVKQRVTKARQKFQGPLWQTKSYILNAFQYMKQVISIVNGTCDRRNMFLNRGIHTWSWGKLGCPVSTASEHQAASCPEGTLCKLPWTLPVVVHLSCHSYERAFWQQMF